jgi:hypothetical protein
MSAPVASPAKSRYTALNEALFRCAPLTFTGAHPFILRIIWLRERPVGPRGDESGVQSLALRPVDTETFYREVDEELRREQLMSLWERYGKLVIGLVILLIAALGFFFWWQYHQEQTTGKRSGELIQALDDVTAGKPTAARARLDALSTDKQAGPRAAALLVKADILLGSNNDKGAAALFHQIANDGSLPQQFRDLALIRATTTEYDMLKPQAVIDRLKAFAVPGNPWFGSAGELVAGAYLKLNKPQQAARLFADMAKEKKLPESLRSRAAQMAGSLGVDALPEPGGKQEG